MTDEPTIEITNPQKKLRRLNKAMEALEEIEAEDEEAVRRAHMNVSSVATVFKQYADATEILEWVEQAFEEIGDDIHKIHVKPGWMTVWYPDDSDPRNPTLNLSVPGSNLSWIKETLPEDTEVDSIGLKDYPEPNAVIRIEIPGGLAVDEKTYYEHNF